MGGKCPLPGRTAQGKCPLPGRTAQGKCPLPGRTAQGKCPMPGRTAHGGQVPDAGENSTWGASARCWGEQHRASARCRGEQHDFCSSRWGTWMRKQGDKLKDHVFYHHHQINILLEAAPQVALVLKNPPANAGSIRDVGLIPGLGRTPGGGNGNSLQYSFLENPMDRGAWQPTVHGAANRWAQLKQLSTCGTV